ncbi:hypothetical protein BN3662_03075 [Clostridiales bacterium CHKCI006]|nr:hypothetical protein BN3662_03075 [Clostridiales bacterium CHKCI006]
MLSNMDCDALKEALSELDLKEYLKLFVSHSRPEIENNQGNKKLLEALYKYGFINGFTLVANTKYYRVEKNHDYIRKQ